MINKDIMVRELVNAYPTYLGVVFHDFVYGLIENRQHDVLFQVYSDIVVHGGKVVQTVDEWNAIPEHMGWKALNFCGTLQIGRETNE